MAARGGGGVAVPGSVQEVSGWGATRSGLVACGSSGNGRTVGLDDLVGPFQPCGSMILWLHRVMRCPCSGFIFTIIWQGTGGSAEMNWCCVQTEVWHGWEWAVSSRITGWEHQWLPRQRHGQSTLVSVRSVKWLWNAEEEYAGKGTLIACLVFLILRVKQPGDRL